MATTGRKRARLELNLGALTQVQQALAQGLVELGESIARDAASNVEVSTDSWHIRDHWGVAAFVDGKKVGDVSADGSATAKPRAFRTPKGLSGIVGFDFPARFHEVGTSDTRAYPFLAPAGQRGAARAGEIMARAVAPLLRRP
jgi:hypothetical protein